MKKKFLFSIIFVFLAIFSANLYFSIPTNNSTKTIVENSFDEYNQGVRSLIAKENCSPIYLDKNIDSSTLIKTLSSKLENSDNVESTISKISNPTKSFAIKNTLSSEKILEICAELDLLFRENETNYELFPKYGLKRILAEGELTNTYGASTTFSYNGSHVLVYDSEKETKEAYLNLLKDKNLIVAVDTIMSINESQTQSAYNYSQHKTWGAKAMDLGVYMDYLSRHNINQDVVVAVIDTGINTSHTMFSGRLLTGATYVGSSYVDDNGHGSHVAGTICDLTPSNVKILPIKAFYANKSGYMSDIRDALKSLSTTYSHLNIVCVNMSFGMYYIDSETGAEYQDDVNNENALFSSIFTTLRNANIMPVASAGNNYDDTYHVAPAGCSNAIVVSALKQTTTSYTFDTSYSNYGSTVDISAPGTSIYSAYMGSSTAMATLQGTSMAAPHVSAAVALLCLDDYFYDGTTATYTMTQIEDELLSLTIDLGSSGRDTLYGEGMVSFANFKREISFTATNTVKTYDGNYHNISITVTDNIDYTITYGLTVGYYNIADYRTNNFFKNATTKKTIYFQISAEGYANTTGYAYLTINPRPITIKLDNKSINYGNSIETLTPTYSTTSGSLVSGDDLKLSLSSDATASSPIGSSYTLSAISANSNYNTTIQSSSLTIIPRALKLNLQNQTGTYGNNPALSNTAFDIDSSTTLAECDTISSLNTTISTTATTSSSIGSYPLTLTWNNSNYNITYTSANYIINPREISLKINNQTGVYGNNHPSNLVQTDYIVTNATNSDDIIVTLSTNATNNSSVGDYQITATFSSITGNHTLTEENTTNGVFTVTQRTVKISTTQSEYYGYNHKEILENKAITSGDYEVIESNFISTDVFTLKFSTTAISSSNVGSYPISVSCSNANYIVLTESDFQVEARPISLIINQSFVYGSTINLNNTDYFLSSGSSLAFENDNLGLVLNHDAGNQPNAGNYAITITDYSNKNYDITLESGTLVVSPKAINPNISSITQTYGNTLNQASFNFTLAMNSLVYSDTLSNLNVTYIVLDQEDNEVSISNKLAVGTYKITIKSIDNNNYTLKTITTGTLTINTKTISINIGNQEITYGESVNLNAIEISLKSGSLVEGDNLGVSLVIENPSNNAGNYKIKYLNHSNTNYTISNASSCYGTLTISAKPIEITINSVSLTYGDLPFSAEFTINANDLEYSDTKNDLGLSFVVQNQNGNQINLSASTGVGEYQFVLESYSNKNYDITATSGNITISAKELTLNVENITLQYGDSINSSKFTFSVVGLANEEDKAVLNLELTSSAIGTLPNAGTTHPITYVSHDNNNYIITNPNIEGILTISKREVVVEVSVLSIYGDEIDLTDYKVSATEGSIVSGDNLNLELSTTLNSSTAIGTYTDCLSINLYDSNYDIISYSSVVKIAERIVIITIENQTATYGYEISLDQTKYTIENLPTGENAQVTLKIKENYEIGIDAGSVLTITAIHSGIPDSCAVEIVEGKLIIEKRDVSITVNNLTKSYGDEIVSSDLSYTVSSGSIFNSSLSITLSTEAKAGDNVGNYEISATTSEPNGKQNYNMSISFGTLTIKSREITITTLEQNSIYGLNHNEQLNQSKFTVSNAIDGDDLKITLSSDATASALVGQNFDISAVTNNSNYEITLTTKGKLTIVARPVEISFKAEPLATYGDNHLTQKTLNNNEYVIVGEYDFLASDSSNLTLLYYSNIPNSTSVGEYEITIISSNSNYSVITNSNYNITAKEISITINNQNLLYGDEININDFDYTIDSDLVGADTAEDLLVELQLEQANIYYAGNYSIIYKTHDNKNYSLTANLDAVLTVAPKVITITLENQKGYYGDEVSLDQTKWSTAANSIINDDELNIVLTTEASNESAVDDYLLTLTYNNPNYSVQIETAKYSVIARPIKISITQAIVYGNEISLNNDDFKIENGNLIDGTNLGLNLSTTAVRYDGVNTYPITHTYSNKNYDLTVLSAQLKITPRPVIITIGNSETIYGENVEIDNLNYTTTSNSIVNNDNLNISLSTNATNKSNVGVYAITGNYSNSNYNAIFVNGTHTINKRQITIKLNNQTTKRGITFSLSNTDFEVIEGTIANPELFEIETYSNANMFSWIGSYDLMAKSDNPNYEITFINAKLDVKFSVFDIIIPAVLVAGVIAIIIIVVKVKKKKQKNKELFDKWIKWWFKTFVQLCVS